MKILVIGGGAAGMMAAISAADAGAEVILAEKNEKTGKKLYITGKGRCNITNAAQTEDFFDNVLSNPRFLYSAVYSFDHDSVCAFFEKEGLRLKEERGNRIFPASDKSSDVIKTLEKAMTERNVRLLLNTTVCDIITEQGHFRKALVRKKGILSEIEADAVIIATGGLSYASTGSTGDGYLFAEKLGHRITSCHPSLVALRVGECFVSELEGLSLRNVSISMDRYSGFGEMLFTADGVSGPLILSASAFLGKKIAALADIKGEDSAAGIPLLIDLKPALTDQQLDARILRDFNDNRNKDFKNSLSELLPSRMIPVIVSLSGIDEHKKVNEISRNERKELVRLIKNFQLTVIGSKGFEQAVITQGGVNVKDVDPSTMQSRKISGLYFAGEVLDVDAYTGGFNLQIAWSTGFLAGRSSAQQADIHDANN